MQETTMTGWVRRFVALSVARPFRVLSVALALTALAGLLASRLELRTRYDALLPDSQPSVQELRRVEARTTASQTVLVVLEGDDRAALRSLGDAAAAALRGLGPEIISGAESGIHDARRFLGPRAGLFLDQEKLEALRAEVDARWDREVARAAGTLLDDDAEEEPAEALLARFRPKGASGDADRFPDGYYERKDGKALVVVARSPLAGGDLGRIGPALHRIYAAIDGVKAQRPEWAAVRVSYAGDMPTGYIEYGVVKDDLLSVGGTGIALVLLVVLLYFRRVQALLVMGACIFIGLFWTFGLTQLAIGHLNVATAFLISIVAGNGINVGILYQARYYEERRGGASVPAALETALAATWRPTLVAALAAGASYGSLLVTDFRAFRHFGLIAGAGMLLCWFATTLALPPLLALLGGRKGEAPPARGAGYGDLFAWLVPRAPAAWVALGAVAILIGSVATARYVQSDPMEYDMNRVQNDRTRTADLHRAWAIATDVLGASQGAMVVLTDTPAEAKQLHDELQAKWDAAPEGSKPFVSVTSLWSFVPEGQAAKIPTLVALGERLRRAHERGLLPEDAWAKLEAVLPPDDLRPFTLADLPASLAETFTERDGTRGTLVLIAAEPTESNDLRYLLRYTESFRETRLASGKVVRGSGRAVIFADMLEAVVQDVPKAISLSLGLTLLTVVLTFRRASQSLPILFSLLAGVAAVGAFLYFAGVRINFLNFAALPITFGIGVDYAVNVAQRYHEDKGRDVAAALRTSGGAVVLCSLTTMLGYLALLVSHNQAIRGLGVIAVVGEIACLLSAMLVLPALWIVFSRRPWVPAT